MSYNQIFQKIWLWKNKDNRYIIPVSVSARIGLNMYVYIGLNILL